MAKIRPKRSRKAAAKPKPVRKRPAHPKPRPHGRGAKNVGSRSRRPVRPRKKPPSKKLILRKQGEKLVYRDAQGHFAKPPKRSSQVRPLIRFKTPQHQAGIPPAPTGAKRIQRLKDLASRSKGTIFKEALDPNSQNTFEKGLPASAAEQFTRSRRQRRTRQLEKALGKFRYGAKDYGKIFFVTLDGKRSFYRPDANFSGKMGYFVQVEGLGRLVVLNGMDRNTVARGNKRTGAPEPVNARFADLSVLQKNAPGEFEALLPRPDAMVYSPIKSELIFEGDLTGWLQNAADTFMRRALAARFEFSQWILRGAVLLRKSTDVIDFSSGLLRSQYYLQFDDKAMNRRLKITSGRDWRQHVMDLIYAGLALALQLRGYVSAGSTRRIRKLKWNKGKDRMKWLNKRGDTWDGRKMIDVQIEELEWKLEKLL